MPTRPTAHRTHRPGGATLRCLLVLCLLAVGQLGSACRKSGDGAAPAGGDDGANGTPAGTGATGGTGSDLPGGTPQGGTGTPGQAAGQPQTPYSKSVTFRGRFDVTDPTRPLFEWENAAVLTRFSGSRKVSIRLDNIENRLQTNTLQVAVDGKETRKITFVPGQSLYLVADNLTPDAHTVQVTKVQEYGFGAIAFGGFELDEGAQVLPPPALPTRRLEFIGSSTLSGWGADGNDKDTPADCHDETNFPLTNAEHSIPRYTADILKADFQNISRGAAGVMCTYTRYVKLVPQTYDLITDHNSPKPWDHSLWQADAVVMEIGGSDFVDGDTVDPLLPVGKLRGYTSDTADQKQNFTIADFESAFTALIKKIRAAYPKAIVVLVNTKNATGQSKDAFFASLDNIAKGFTDGKVLRFDYFQTPIPNKTTPYNDWYGMVNDLGSGCEDHPNPAGAQYMADRLAEYLRIKLGW